jgi:NAD(P)-dependent dehydrogenase (short-subunit alcohol dehydrogenase family)
MESPGDAMTANPNAKPVCGITGASSGIGLATAKLFARLGYRVAICGRDPKRLADAAEDVRNQNAGAADVLDIVSDVGDQAQAQRFIRRTSETYGRLDVLVNNAGFAPKAPIAEFPHDDLRSAIDINVAAVFATTQAVWPIMQHQGGGTIVNISSLSAIDPFPGFGVYGACKAWVDLFTKAMGAEGRDAGIRTFALRLGAVETPMLRSLFPEFPVDQTLAPAEVAQVISQIVTEPFRFASGEAICLRK